MIIRFISFFVIAVIVFSCHHTEKSIPVTDSLEFSESQDTFPSLLNQAQEKHKNLFLVFGFEQCAWCRIFKQYHSDPEVRDILSQYYIIAEIDYNITPGGKELYRTFGSAGFPSWSVLDTAGKVLANCNAPMPGVKNRTYPIGYPYKKDALEYYINVLKSTSDIDELACSMLKEKVLFYSRAPQTAITQ